MTRRGQGRRLRRRHLDDLGEGRGFRKVRKELGVTAFGVNAIVLPPDYETGKHYHDEQEELYFVHQGADGDRPRRHQAPARPGGLAWVDARSSAASRTSATREDAIYVCVGGKDGYVGRDGAARGEISAPAGGHSPERLGPGSGGGLRLARESQDAEVRLSHAPT